jgi:hypothetical protein
MTTQSGLKCAMGMSCGSKGAGEMLAKPPPRDHETIVRSGGRGSSAPAGTNGKNAWGESSRTSDLPTHLPTPTLVFARMGADLTKTHVLVT